MSDTGRRGFITTLAALGAGAALRPLHAGASESLHTSPVAMPARVAGLIAVASANGLAATAKAMQLLRGGADALDAVIAGVNLVEDDPNDDSVGYGGLPNEDGVVELDASVMHGPSGRGAGVAALCNIKNPSKVARLVMERTDHVLLVGEGALRFARAHGFTEENLLTDQSRRKWLEWKESLNREDDWLPPHDASTKDIGDTNRRSERQTGTINCIALDAKGNLSGCTTTSGLAFKIPGRVGDSPILGAGLYVDNTVGAAGSTGRGEANLLACSSIIIVEQMRLGATPEEACLRACTRIVDQTKMRRLQNDEGKPAFNVKFYALDKRGRHGSAAIWNGGQYAVNTGEDTSRLAEAAYLYKRPAR